MLHERVAIPNTLCQSEVASETASTRRRTCSQLGRTVTVGIGGNSTSFSGSKSSLYNVGSSSALVFMGLELLSRQLAPLALGALEVARALALTAGGGPAGGLGAPTSASNHVLGVAGLGSPPALGGGGVFEDTGLAGGGGGTEVARAGALAGSKSCAGARCCM